MKKLLFSIGLVFFFSIFCHSQSKYEFRAVWIASVENIDWPSRKGLSSDSQRAEFIRILDLHKRNGMNAVVVQVRPAADAFYPSQYEPWSEWLTGKQGAPPAPYYDPLQFMIEETHKRGMEFHAWCNPYRAIYHIGTSSLSATHITKTHPEWFLSYGGTGFFDPGNKEVQRYVTEVIRDIVNRYDIDALHLDDYFYPYRIAGREFPDDSCFRKYGNGMTKDDWRRSNTDSIILSLARAIKETKPWVRFGISPFCTWRNKSQDPEGSETHAGQTNYDDLYADILLWLKNGWIDYVVPQLYFEFGHRAAPYEVLLDWWSRHAYGRQLFIGLGPYRLGTTLPWKDKTLIPRQIQALRAYSDVQGAVYFSSKNFEKNPYGLNDSLQENYYRYPALIPPMPWLDTTRPGEPLIDPSQSILTRDSVRLHIENAHNDPVKLYVVYYRPPGSFPSGPASDGFSGGAPNTDDPRNIYRIIPAAAINSTWIRFTPVSGTLPLKDLHRSILVTAIGINNEESLPADAGYTVRP